MKKARDMSARNAKAVTKDEQSDAIVVSFNSDCDKKLLDGSFSAVIRKRIPRSVAPKWLYLHINSPVSAICGRARIKTIKDISLDEALAISNQLDLAPDVIRKYVGYAESIGCYLLSDIQTIPHKLKTEVIRDSLDYYPPQSFMVLAKHAKRIIDLLAGLEKESR